MDPSHRVQTLVGTPCVPFTLIKKILVSRHRAVWSPSAL